MMSFVRRIAKGLFGFLFTVSLILAITLFGVSQITQIDSVKSITSELLGFQTGGEDIPISAEGEELLNDVRAQCGEDSLQEFQIAGVSITCDEANAIGEEMSVSDFVVSKVVDGSYFTEYDCDFVSCLLQGEEPFPLVVTKHANDFYSEAFNYMLVVALIFGALFVIAAETTNERMRSVGFSLLWVSVPFLVGGFFIDDIVLFVAPPEWSSPIAPVIESLVNRILEPVLMIYVYILAAAVALVVAGYVVRPEMLRLGKK